MVFVRFMSPINKLLEILGDRLVVYIRRIFLLFLCALSGACYDS